MGSSVTVAQMRALLELLRELHSCLDEATLRRRLTDTVDRLVPCDLVSLNHIDMDGTNGGTKTAFSGNFVAGPELNAAFDEFAHQHPLLSR